MESLDRCTTLIDEIVERDAFSYSLMRRLYLSSDSVINSLELRLSSMIESVESYGFC